MNTDIENLNSVPFSNDELHEFDILKYKLGESSLGSVDLSKVKGCTHPRYSGCRWHELKPVKGTIKGNREDPNVAYQKLKRAISIVRDLTKNPEYYVSLEQKHHWSFYVVNGSYYIDTGMHRTIIARYFLFLNCLPEVVHGVTITKVSLIELADQQPKKIELSFFQKIKSVLAL